ncbi:kinase-like protein, partial [Cenococcum geophilum 1.58]|uniref:kinase-like protein n=1 Tax=Cenococcum geophilum 1.58 TaxID=794803 RepID=UPI00358E4114
HPYLVKYFDSQDGPGYFKIFIEFIPFSDLKQYTKNRGGMLAKEVAKLVVSQIFSAVTFMHRHHCIYRDLKPKNILVYA